MSRTRIFQGLPMRFSRLAGIFALLIAGAAEASLPPQGHDAALFGECGSALFGPESCAVAVADEVTIAAELLYASMGNAAVSFASDRAEQLLDEEEFEAAELWRRIAAAAAELALRRPAAPGIRR
jgi:hypothetical protein